MTPHLNEDRQSVLLNLGDKVALRKRQAQAELLECAAKYCGHRLNTLITCYSNATNTVLQY